ncbi:MAG: DHH family phosphoesterase [Clostridia bacterium]|nr:DHH family phosphoesterase [Clostridia bacterium]
MGEIRNLCERFRKVYIQPHNYPDADAIASAWGMKKLVESFGAEAEIIYYGSNTFKPNISKILSDYRIRMTLINEGYEIGEEELLINVDCQYGAANVHKVVAKNIAVVDHHIKEAMQDYIYEDIQPRIGACTTLVLNYLKQFGVRLDQPLATVMYYGIFMDTDMFNGRMTTLDEDAKKELTALYDKNIIDHLRLSSLSFEDLKIYASGILKTERYQNIIFSGIEECDDNLLGHISDLLMEIEGINIVIAYSQRSNGCKLSIRSYHDYFTAEELVRELTDGIGSGGGHENKAGGYIVKNRLEQVHPRVSLGILIRTKIIDYCREVRLLQTGKDNPYDIFSRDKLFRAKKKKICLRFLDIRDYFKEDVAVKTLEGTATASVKDKVIIGVKNDIWPISSETFEKKYQVVDHKNTKCLSDGYLDEYGVSIQSDSMLLRITKDNIHEFKICMTVEESMVDAVKLYEKVKVRTVWGDFLGKRGDYLLINSLEDYYICDGEIFKQTYDKIV